MSILIRQARYLIRSADRVERDVDVLIHGRRIAAIGPNLEAELTTAGKMTVLDGRARAVMPGLINAHTHLYQCVLRGLHSDLPLEPWLQAVVFPYRRQARLAYPDEAMMVAASRAGCAEMLKNGTTAFIDMDSTIGAAWRAWQEMGIRGAAAFNVANAQIPPELVAPLADIQRRVLEQLAECRALAAETPTLSFMIAAASPQMCSRPLLEWIAATAEAEGIMIHGHCAETAVEFRETVDETGFTPVGWLAEAGMLTPHTSLAHCVHVTPADRALLAEHETIPVHCPKSNMKLASGVSPAPAMLGAGIAVALANDGPASNDLQDMFEEMRFAALLHKVEGQADALTAQDAFRMATEHSARAAGIDAGVLDPGRLADVVLLNLEQPHLAAPGEIVPLLVYCAQGRDVDTVIVDGRIVVAGGRLTLADEAEIVERARRLGAERYRAMTAG
ncbi:MAG: amidohydrolase [Anaerolineales bacterium]|nr:amidohydrolase [Anaerolineales bacterium]